MSDRREFFEQLVYHSVDGRRFTQQSPTMPDVWIQYGFDPGIQLDLLLVPDSAYSTSELARALRTRLAEDADRDPSTFRYCSPDVEPKPPAIAANTSVVAARLYLDEVVRVALPLSRWWTRTFVDARAPGRAGTGREIRPLQPPFGDHESRDRYIEALSAALADPRGSAGADRQGLLIHRDVEWLARVAGLLGYLSTEQGSPDPNSEEDQVESLVELRDNHAVLASVFVRILEGIEEVDSEDDNPLYSINLNRRGENSISDSVPTTKADAARRVFGVQGRQITWAVIDSGFDATHTAFRRRTPSGAPDPLPFTKRTGRRRARRRTGERRFDNHTRIVRTLDFVNIRNLLGTEPGDVDSLDRSEFPALATPKMRDTLSGLLKDFQAHTIRWDRLEPFLEVPHDPDEEKGYRPPTNPHGTHVAGIIGADWRERDGEPDVGDDENEDETLLVSAPNGDVTGICPEINLIDLRVLNANGSGDEFAIMSALQFVRDLNSRRDVRAIHGVNLSFSIPHDVANYACGRTPVCDEAEQLVAGGVVVVAAAGNCGRARYLTPAGSDDGFRTVSITDPGNAAGVLTVGATHRSDPHTYGVSYFSSRGPTGDGRRKPDLVAPGEKITSTVPGNRAASLDGTSMAAPHVSGAAALIMARHLEFMGQPDRIKEILCSSATDLGREPYFQGAGLLDILRALQSI